MLAGFPVHLAPRLCLFAVLVAPALFTLARVLFNFGLVCPAFSPGLVYFGQAPVYFWLGCPAFSPGFVYFGEGLV